MKLTFKDIFAGQKIIAEISNMKLKFKTMRNLEKLIKDMTNELEFIERQRLILVDKYKGADNVVSPENIQLFNTEFLELLNTEIEINAEPIDQNEIENIELTFEEFNILKPFLNS